MIPPTVCWLFFNALLSLPVCLFIRNFISKKSVLSITLVDLIYRDTILYLYSMCLILSVALARCIVKSSGEETLATLSYNEATVYSVSIMTLVGFMTVSLIFSGGLRLISILRYDLVQTQLQFSS